MRHVEIRVGLPEVNGGFVDVATRLDMPVLVSANRFRRRGKERKTKGPGWRGRPLPKLMALDVALDSAGFVAMKKYGGFPWTPEEYVRDLVQHGRWTWWAAMDYCNEPEIAKNTAEVRDRVQRTAATLAELRELAVRYKQAPPMPVMQGWHPDQYEECVGLTDKALGGEWPALVGVGSVCRRKLGGADGLEAVVGRLDRILPPSVGLHLFGVKSDALGAVAGLGRVAAMDSCAWDYNARKTARALGDAQPYNMAWRTYKMITWWERQRERAGDLFIGKC